MKDDDRKPSGLGISLPGASATDLRGKQSVRATFKLSERTISAVSIVATHLGIKQKSLFDHLIEDIQSLSAIADKIQHQELRKQQGVQKTYVMSRKSLLSLDQISRDYDTPRDALVEYSVQRLLPIISRERERHKNRKKILVDLRRHAVAGREMLEKAEDMLGGEDPILMKLRAAVTATESACQDAESFVERGSIIEDF